MIEALLQQERELLRARINSETAKIPWQELQRFFAGGSTLYVTAELDLVDVACAFSEDDVAQVKTWREHGYVCTVGDEQAMTWYEKNCSLWAVVVKPWVLVQPIRD